MNASWREILAETGEVPADAESLAGDIDLLIPIEPDWRVLDVSGGYGARAEVLAHRSAQVVAATHDPTHMPVLAARAHSVGQGKMVPLLLDHVLPFDPRSFNVLVYEEDSHHKLEQYLPFLKPGGWLVWLIGAVPPPSPDVGGLQGILETAKATADWLQARMAAPTSWRQRLNRLGFEDTRTYIHMREYAWGYLPFDAYWLQRYYLESLQEEAVGGGRGKAKIARLLGKGGVYPFLASAHVVVSRAPGEDL